MHKFVFVSMIVITAATSFAAPSFAQSAGKGRDGGGHHSSESNDWYPGAGSFTHYDNHNRRRPKVILTKSGAYCVENRRWVDARGYVHFSPYRECRNRIDIAID